MISHWYFWWDQLWAYNVFYLICVISWNLVKVFSSIRCSNGIANTWLATPLLHVVLLLYKAYQPFFIYTRIYWISFDPIFVSLLSVDWLFWTEVFFYIHLYVCIIYGYGSPFFVSHVTEIGMTQKWQSSTTNRWFIGKLSITEDVIVMVHIFCWHWDLYVCNIKGYGFLFFVSHITEIRMSQKGQSSTRCSIGKLFISEDVIVMVYISLLVLGKIVLAMLRA